MNSNVMYWHASQQGIPIYHNVQLTVPFYLDITSQEQSSFVTSESSDEHPSANIGIDQAAW